MLLFFIVIGIVAYAAGDPYFEVYKFVVIFGLVLAVLNQLSGIFSAHRARKAARRNDRAVRKAQKELRRSMKSISNAKREATSAVRRMSLIDRWREESRRMEESEGEYEVEEDEIMEEDDEDEPVKMESSDPYDINFKELSIEQLQKRLNVLYSRMDKMKYQHGATKEEWEKYKKTATYRGVDWDITDTEERLARAIEREKARWASA